MGKIRTSTYYFFVINVLLEHVQAKIMQRLFSSRNNLEFLRCGNIFCLIFSFFSQHLISRFLLKETMKNVSVFLICVQSLSLAPHPLAHTTLNAPQHYLQDAYCLSKKQLPILYGNFLYKMSNYFLDIQLIQIEYIYIYIKIQILPEEIRCFCFDVNLRVLPDDIRYSR